MSLFFYLLFLGPFPWMKLVCRVLCTAGKPSSCNPCCREEQGEDEGERRRASEAVRRRKKRRREGREKAGQNFEEIRNNQEMGRSRKEGEDNLGVEVEEEEVWGGREGEEEEMRGGRGEPRRERGRSRRASRASIPLATIHEPGEEGCGEREEEWGDAEEEGWVEEGLKTPYSSVYSSMRSWEERVGLREVEEEEVEVEVWRGRGVRSPHSSLYSSVRSRMRGREEGERTPHSSLRSWEERMRRREEGGRERELELSAEGSPSEVVIRVTNLCET